MKLNRRSETLQPTAYSLHPIVSIRPFGRIVFLATSLAFLLGSCQPQKPTIKIGINAELTGEVPAVGASCRNAAQLFVNEVNQAGGIDVGGTKMPLTLIIRDNGAKADQCAAVSQRLISQDGVIAMVGPNASSCAIPAAEIAESLNCLMISPWSTNPKTTIDTSTGHFKKNVFRACFTETVEEPILAKFALNNLHASKAAILYDMSSETPNSDAKLFSTAFTNLGGKIVAMETYTTGDRDFSAQLTNIKKTSPDIIFLPAYYNDVPLIAEQARRLGIKTPLIGNNAWSTPEMIKLDTGHYLNGSYFSNHFSTGSDLPNVQQFVKSYQEKYGQPPDDIAALTYDTMGLLTEAIIKAGKLDRKAVSDSMTKIKKFQGITGNFNYRSGSRDPMKSVIILQLKDGAFVYVMTLQP